MAVEFACADDAEVPEIVALMNRAYRGGDPAAWNREAYIAGTRTTAALLREQIAARPDGAQLVWREAGALVGTVWLAPEADGGWYLGGLTIDPAAQDGGRGGALLAAAEDWARARGARSMRMTVIGIRDALLAWYGRRGYAPTGETEPFPYGDDRFGTPLRDDLGFVVLAKTLA